MIKKYFAGLVRLIFVKAPIFVLGVWCCVFNPIVKFTTYPKIKLKNLILFQLIRKLDYDIKNQGIIFNGMYRIPSIRGSMLLMKEPDTINWINNHIKIDVDGNEGKIISGMKNTLKDNKLKSLSIELDFSKESDVELFDSLKKSGFVSLNDSKYQNKVFS